MPHRANGCDGATPLVAPFHNRSIQLVSAGAIEYRAAAGVKQGIIFEKPDHLLHGIETRAAALERLDADVKRLVERWLDALDLFRCQLFIPTACPAVNCNGEPLVARGRLTDGRPQTERG